MHSQNGNTALRDSVFFDSYRLKAKRCAFEFVPAVLKIFSCKNAAFQSYFFFNTAKVYADRVSNDCFVICTVFTLLCLQFAASPSQKLLESAPVTKPGVVCPQRTNGMGVRMEIVKLTATQVIF